MDSAELLEQLADIHLPGAVSYWPPAPGWWLLAMIVIALAGWLAFKALQARRQRQVCAYAIQELTTVYQTYQQRLTEQPELQNENRLLFVNEVNAVLRRVALWHYPQHNIASLGGRAWVDFIREKGESSLLTDELAQALEEGRFKTRCDVDAEQLHQFGEHWIESLYTHRTGALNSPNIGT